MRSILVVASTFPTSDTDPVPAFVRDQIIAMKRVDPSFHFTVLAPHDKRSNTKRLRRREYYDEYRFHYFWPHSAEKLAGRGIMPALKANPLNYLLIPFLFIGEFYALLRLTMRLKPELIYAHWFTPQVVTTQIVGKLTDTPYVFTTHASDVAVWHKIPLIGNAIVRLGTRHAVRFTAVSRRSMSKLQQFFSDSSWSKLQQRSAIIPMGIELPKLSKTVGSNPQTILFVGRFAEKKGIQYLLPAFRALRQKQPNVRLILAGDGPQRASLERQVAELELSDSVEFPGYVSADDRQKLAERAGVYVVPSIITTSGDAEGLPVSLMEGLSYGKICIATNESGADDILTNGRDGFLVAQKDTKALTKVLERAVTLGTSERHAMQDTAIETAEQFAWPRVAKQHIDFLFRDKK